MRAPTQQAPITAPRDDMDAQFGVRSIEDPRESTGQSTDSDQRKRTIAEAVLNAVRIHAAHDDDLAWAAAAFHPM